MKSNPEIVAEYLSKDEKYQSAIYKNTEEMIDQLSKNVQEAVIERIEADTFQLSKMQVIAISFGILAVIGIGVIIGLYTLTSFVAR